MKLTNLLLTASIVLGVVFMSNPSMATLVPPAGLDFSDAVILDLTRPLPAEKMAATMLSEETARRTHLSWPIIRTAAADARQTIVLGTREEYKAAGIAFKPAKELDAAEGYSIQVEAGPTSRQIKVVGSDSRGVLFGVGGLLRAFSLQREHAWIAPDTFIATRPAQSLRGHQLGYRPKTNSYDGWTIAMWEQYFRDLIIFGTNAIELIPPRSDDAADSPMFPEPPLRMMEKMDALLADYGLDVWVWFPAMDADYSTDAAIRKAVTEWSEIFKRLKRIDAIFVPGGDPGHTDPDVLMKMLAQQSVALHSYHPGARIWVSPQGFTTDWTNRFLEILQKDQPNWFGGVVFGPQVRMPLPDLRKAVPAKYPIRHYPDITHMVLCQFPVEDWDMAWALTEGRESINPRPEAQALICKWHQPFTVGSISYSEGCNDDVNKMIWSALGWDPGQNVTEILRQYSRVFIDERFEIQFADGLLGLERNWVGSADTCPDVMPTLHTFQEMERRAMPLNKLNWRFQQALYRAYYDAYVQLRARAERDAEKRAMAALREARTLGAQKALSDAEQALSEVKISAEAQEYKAAVQRLAEALFQSIHMQLSVKQYYAIGAERGANLDQMDVPVNDSIWLKKRLAYARSAASEQERISRIEQITQWEEPGLGGFYDLLSDPARRPHLLQGQAFAQDPGHLNSVRIGHNVTFGGRLRNASWAETLYDVPLVFAYKGLQPGKKYKVRVVYGTDVPQVKVRLDANGVQVHDWMSRPIPAAPMEFLIPEGAIKNKQLTLTFKREQGLGGNGRGCQVSEIWLIPVP
jgi:hypothetical protein